MTIHTAFTVFPQLISDLEFIVSHCRGPQSAKSTVTDWTNALNNCDEQAWQLDNLKPLCDALVIIAFSNTAFCMLPVRDNNRFGPHYEIEDRGGYLLALKSIATILSSAPLCDDCHVALVRGVEKSLTTHLQEIEKRLPIR